MEEVTAGVRELAQFGVVVQPEDAEKSLNTIAMIKEIASYSNSEGGAGGGIKQIRQEIQALFTGSARITDQFARMIKNTMPDVWRQLSDKTLTAAERWKILNERVWDFSAAVRLANRTVANQAAIARKNIEIISKMALDKSGIFDKWVTTLFNFNKQLFNTRGELQGLGIKLQEIFADIWTSVDYTIRATYYLAKVMYDIYSAAKYALRPFNDILTTTVKVLATMFLLKTVVQMVRSAAVGLYAATGLRALIPVLPAIAAGLWAVIPPLAMFTATIAGGLAAGYAFYQLATVIEYGWDKLVEKYGPKLANAWAKIKTFFKIMAQEAKEFASNMFIDIEDRKQSPLLTKLYEEMEELNRFGQTGGASGSWGKGQLPEQVDDLSTRLATSTDKYLEGLNILKEALTPSSDLLQYKGKPFLAGIGDALTEFFGPENVNSLLGNLEKFMANFSKILGDGIVNIRQDNLIPDPRGDGSFNLGNPPVGDEKKSKKALYALDLRRLLIDDKLATLAHKYNTYVIDTGKYLKEQVYWQKAKLADEIAYRDSIDKTEETGQKEFNAAQKRVFQLSLLIDGVQYKLDRFNFGPGRGFQEGLKEWMREIENIGEAWIKMGKDVASSMQSTFSDVVFDWLKGELKSTTDYVKAFGDTVNRILADMAAQLVANKIATSVGKLFGYDPATAEGAGMGSGGNITDSYNTYNYYGDSVADSALARAQEQSADKLAAATTGATKELTGFGKALNGTIGWLQKMLGGAGGVMQYAFSGASKLVGYIQAGAGLLTSAYQGMNAPNAGPQLPEQTFASTDTLMSSGNFNPGADYQFARGGVITEPVYGRGLNSGKSYSFAENGRPEQVLSNTQMQSSNGGGLTLAMKNDFSALIPKGIIAELNRRMEETALQVLRANI
jgi:hypothetical protein